MAFDLEGKRLLDIMQHRDVRWLHPPDPCWKMKPPTLASWLLKLGWTVDDYDQRFTGFINALLADYPGSLLAFDRDPTELGGTWEAVAVKQPSFKEAETGAYTRALESKPLRAYKVPFGADAERLARFLGPGGWAMWKPGDSDKGGIPRILAQDVLKTVREHNWHYLVVSWWDNEFTEMAVNPELVRAHGSAAA